MCTFILHIHAYTCAEKKIYVKKAQEISRVHMRHMLITISTRMYIMFPRWTSWLICIAWFRGSARSDTSRKPTVPESVEGEIYKTHENECFRLDNLRQEIHKFWGRFYIPMSWLYPILAHRKFPWKPGWPQGPWCADQGAELLRWSKGSLEHTGGGSGGRISSVVSYFPSSYIRLC